MRKIASVGLRGYAVLRKIFVLGCATIFITARAASFDESGAAAKAYSEDPIVPRWISALAGTADITIERLVLDEKEIRAVHLPLRLDDGEVRLEGGVAEYAGGRLQFDARHDPVSLETELRIQGHDLSTSLMPSWQSLIAAPVNVELELKARGNSVGALVSTMNGEVFIDIGRGTLPSRTLAQAGENIFTAFFGSINPFVSSSGPLPIACAKAHLVIADGKAERSRMAAIQADDLVMTCGGGLNFVDESTNLKCYPSRLSTVNRAIPTGVESVSIRGAMAAPSVSVKTGGLLRQGVSLGGSIAAKPLPGLAGVIGTAGRPACAISLP